MEFNPFAFESQNRRPDGIAKRGIHYEITLMGVTKSLAAWARIYGVKPATAYARIRRGLQPFVAMSDTHDLHFHWIDIDGQKRKLRDVAAEHGICPGTMQSRINAGWTPLDAATKPICWRGHR